MFWFFIIFLKNTRLHRTSGLATYHEMQIQSTDLSLGSHLSWSCFRPLKQWSEKHSNFSNSEANYSKTKPQTAFHLLSYAFTK